MASLPCGRERPHFASKSGKRCRQPRFALLSVKRDVAGSKQQRKENEKANRLEAIRFFIGSPCWTRTSDTLINSQVLYRLS